MTLPTLQDTSDRLTDSIYFGQRQGGGGGGGGTITGSGTVNHLSKWHSASDIGDSTVTDVGGVVTVPGILDSSTSAQFKAAGFAAIVDNGTLGAGVHSILWANGNKQQAVITADQTWTFTNPPSICNVLVKVTSTGGPWVITWPGSVVWTGGTVPILTAGSTDIIGFFFDGTTYWGASSAVGSGGALTGSGTPGYIPYRVGALTLGDSSAFFDGVNIGIDTASPARLWDVNGISRSFVQDYGGQVFNVKAFGAVGDGGMIGDVSFPAGSSTLTSTAGFNPFVAADVGKEIWVPGAGAAGVVLHTTIASYIDANNITLTLPNASGVDVVGTASVPAYAYWGGADDTAAFALALSTARDAARPKWYGATVFIPPGVYNIKSNSLYVDRFVTLRGISESPSNKGGMSVLLATAGAASDTGTAFITLEFLAELNGVTIVHPNQNVDASVYDPIKYPFDIAATGYSTVQNVHLFNSYQGIDAASHGSAPYQSVVTIRGVRGQVFSVGIDIDNNAGGCWVSDVAFGQEYSASMANNWGKDNAIGIRVARADQFSFTELSFWNMLIGVQFNWGTRDLTGASYGKIFDLNCDNVQIGIDVNATSNAVTTIVSGFYYGWQGGTYSRAIWGHTTTVDADPDITAHTAAYLSVTNGSIWGGAPDSPVYWDNLGNLDLTNIKLLGWAGVAYAVDIENGRATIQNNHFIDTTIGGATSSPNGILIGVSAGRCMVTGNEMSGAAITIANSQTYSTCNSGDATAVADTRPRARVTKAAVQSVLASSPTPLVFDTSTLDVGGVRSGSTLVVPVGWGGLWMISGMVTLDGVDLGVPCSLSILKNGTQIAQQQVTGYIDQSINCSTAYELADGDVITFDVYHESVAPKNTITGAASTWGAMVKI